MRKLIFFFIILVSAPIFAAQTERPFESATKEFYQKLLTRKFDALEKDATQARKIHSTISDGQPMLAAIYGGISGCLTNGCRNNLSDAEWQQRLLLISEWRKNNPNSVTAEIALAKYYIQYGYAIRGQGYANTVKEEAWKPFKNNIQTAYKLLQQASNSAKKDPEWHASMLEVGVEQEWPIDQFNKIYLDGVKTDSSYLPLYFNTSTYFAPRWHGSPSDLKKFIGSVVAATKDKLGDTMYARLNWSLWTKSMFTDGQADWNKMKKGFERIIADYPDAWNINNFAKFACLANDSATVLKLSKKIGSDPIDAAWWGSARYYHQCVDYAKQSIEQ